MKCTVCSNEIPDGYKFCPECGAPAPQNKVCPKCNTEVPVKMKFCFNCGYSFDNPQSKSAAISGLAMGDKNVVSGDIVGHSEDISVSGNATIIKNNDETKKLVNCNICGKNLTIIETHNCPICGQSVCDDCFNTAMGMCKNCITNSKQSAENEYKEALRSVLSDGIIDLQERRTLEALQQKLGISSDKAKQFENELRFGDKSASESFTTMEKLAMEDAMTYFYEEGNAPKAFETIESVYNSHQYDEKVLSIYLPILAEIDSDKAVSIINSLQADILTAYLVLIDIYLKTDLSQAERKLDFAEKIWPNDTLLKCRRVCFIYEMYKQTGRDMFLNQYNSLVSTLEDGESKIARSWVYKCRNLNDNKKVTMDQCKSMDVFYGIINSTGGNSDNVSVGTEGDYETISEALEHVNEGGTIKVLSGTYNENINITKNVNLVGDGVYSIISLPTDGVLNINSDCTISSLCFKNTSLVKSDNASLALVTITGGEVSFTKCNFDNGNDNGITTSNSCFVKISECNFTHCDRNGIRTNGSSIVNLDNCTFNENQNIGICCCDNSKVTANSCSASKNKSSGISTFDNSQLQLSNCKSFENTNSGYYATNSSQLNAFNCEAYDNGKFGFLYNADSLGMVKGGSSHGNQSSGFGIGGNSKVSVEDSKTTSNTQDGFMCDGGDVTIKNCNSESNQFHGLELTGNTVTKISGCKISYPLKWGMLITKDAKVTADNMDICNPCVSGVGVGGNAQLTLDNSKIYDTGENGILCDGTNTITITNTTLNNIAFNGINANNDATVNCNNCVISDTAKSGIYYHAQSKGSVLNCTVRDTEKASFEVSDNANPYVDGCNFSGAKNGGGIFVYGNAKGTYKNTTVENVKFCPVEVSGCAYPIVDGCTLVASGTSSSIYIHDNGSGTFTNNILSSSNASPLCNVGSQSIVASGNR